MKQKNLPNRLNTMNAHILHKDHCGECVEDDTSG